MAITINTAICDTFRKELLMAVHKFATAAGHTFKYAMVKAQASGSGTYGTPNTNYGAGSGAPSASNMGTDETSDTGGNSRYTAGGYTMATNADPTLDTGNHIAYVDWATDPSWGSDATITSCGAMLYNTSASGASVACFSFSGDKTCTNGTFTVTLPGAAYNTAILRA
jgi:hypothetical protein